MWVLDCEENWVLKNWCFWTVVLEKTLESPLDCKEFQPVHSKDPSWVLIGRTDAKAETPILWLPHAKKWLIGKVSDAGRDWGQEEKGMTEDEVAGWNHRLNGHECEWTLGVGDGQGVLACCDSWGCKESEMTEWLNWIQPTFNIMALPSKYFGFLNELYLDKSCWYMVKPIQYCKVISLQLKQINLNLKKIYFIYLVCDIKYICICIYVYIHIDML